MKRRTQRGSAFIIVLGTIAGLVAIVASVAGAMQVASEARINREQEKRARVIALSGIQYGISSLQGQSATAASHNDAWATMGASAITAPADTVFQVGDGYFRVQVVDACSLIDINTAPEAQLLNLSLTQEEVDSLTDWRSPGETALPDGAKDTFYNGLAQPYNAKLGRLDTVDELLQVQYFTRDVIYDAPTNTTNTQMATLANGQQPILASLITVDATAPLPAGTGRINVSTAGGNLLQLRTQLQSSGLPIALVTQILQRRPFTTYGALLRLPGVTTQEATTMLNRLQVSTATTAEGRINLNTASQSVLSTLPGMEGDTATAIVTQQTTPLTSISQIMSVPGMTVAIAAGLVDLVTVGSQTFLVRTVGWVGNTSVALEATVSVTNGAPKIIKIVDEPFSNMDARWNWADAASTTMLVDPTQVTTQ
ncbi:MAG: helix-hairpin-helix domain-containing protein [Fimbriimonadaceae bacterium]